MTKSLFLDVFAVGPIQANCVLLGDVDAGEVVVIDPGDEGERIAERVRATTLRPTMILHTHGHLDHVAGTAELAQLLGGLLPIGLHPDKIELYRNAPMQGAMFGLEVDTHPNPPCSSSTDRSSRLAASNWKCVTPRPFAGWGLLCSVGCGRAAGDRRRRALCGLHRPPAPSWAAPSRSSNVRFASSSTHFQTPPRRLRPRPQHHHRSGEGEQPVRFRVTARSAWRTFGCVIFDLGYLISPRAR